MNKKMRELLEKIDQLTKQARAFMDGENADTAKAAELMDKVDALKSEYEIEKRIYDQEKNANIPESKEKTIDPQAEKKAVVDPLVSFGKAVKNLRYGVIEKDTMNEGTAADGGYTVPEDIQTKVEKLREASFSLRDLVRSVPVKTNTGARTFKSRSQYTGFTQVGEGAAIGATATPKFHRISYTIKKYAGYMPLTNELLEDSDANVGQIVIEWLANESRATANRLILAAIKTNTETDLAGLDGIKKALNVTLGSAFKNSSKIVTNDDGLQYLDTLKDNDGKYLLTTSPADPMKLILSAGATKVQVEVVPNEDLESTPTYTASTDTSVVSGKTYYTRSGSAGSYVYTAVATPTGNPSTHSYYEMDPTAKIPFIIGDLKEGIAYFDRKQMNIMQSNVAAIGQLNAFEEDLTIYRAIEREDVKVRDPKAFVNGYIQPAAAGE